MVRVRRGRVEDLGRGGRTGAGDSVGGRSPGSRVGREEKEGPTRSYQFKVVTLVESTPTPITPPAQTTWTT